MRRSLYLSRMPPKMEVLCDAHSTGFSRRASCHGRVLEHPHFRGVASSERAREHAFQQFGLADQALEDEFHEMEYEEIPDFPKNCAELLFLQMLGILSVMVVSCGTRTFCYSKRGPRFEQCNQLVRSECAYTFLARQFGTGSVVDQGKNAVFSCACRHPS